MDDRDELDCDTGATDAETPAFDRTGLEPDAPRPSAGERDARRSRSVPPRDADGDVPDL